MVLTDWSKSEIEYVRRALNSGLVGARSGREAFLNGRSLAPFLGEVARNALKPAGVGAGLGLSSGCRGDGHSSITRILGFGLLGSLIGFASGVAWGSRDLMASVAANALKNIGRASDEHWLEKHPIDYA